MQAFGYLRVSGLGQVEGDGFPRQRAAIEAYASGHGLEVVQWFEEKGISGKTELEDRPALQALMTALLADGVKTVIVEKLDRLARDLMLQESILADLRKHEFELISTAEPDLCSDDPTRVLMRQMMGAFAQYERSMIVAKLRAARQRAKASKGRCEGRKPYGTRPGEDAILQRMRLMQAQGIRAADIARTFNAEGIRPRSGVCWYPSNVTRILHKQA